MNSKLDYMSAYNRPRNLSPIASSTSSSKMISEDQYHSHNNHSATVTKLQKEIKHLNQENKELRAQIVELRDSVKQIFTENRHEKFDERRINMIKFQVIQLERQISILTEAIGSRSEAVLEVENTLSVMADRLRSFIAADVKRNMLQIAKSDLVTLIESSESSRIKLFKSIEKNTPQELGKELLYLNPCLNNSTRHHNTVSLLDINLNRLDYINLRYVSQMESKLSVLYKELVRVHNQVENMQGKDGSFRLCDGHSSSSECEGMKTSLLKTGVMIKDCVDDLLALSLLCPSAPWPVLKRPVIKEICMERLIGALPALPPSKQEEVSHILKACTSTFNYRLNLLQKEKAVLREELEFHRSVSETQMDYINAVFDAVREGCKEFENSTRSLLFAPLKSLLEAYKHLETTKSEDALRKILMNLKANESQITSIVEMFEDPEFNNSVNRSEALSSFSNEFMQHINSLVVSCQKKRDAALQDKKEIKEYLKSSEADLLQWIEDLEAKYDKQWISKQDRGDPKTSARHASTPDSILTSSRKKERMESPFNHMRNSKEFIHSQLFGDSDHKDASVDKNSIDNHSRKSNNKECLDDDSTGVLKLRSFLDDDNHSDNGADFNGKKSSHKMKWVSNFNHNDEKDSMPIITQSSTTQKKSKKPWKPEKEWVNDFSNSFEVRNDTTQSYRESNHLIDCSDRRSLGQNESEEVDLKQAAPTKSHQRGKGNRRSYEVDLRVPKQKLTLKKSQNVPRTYADEDKKS